MALDLRKNHLSMSPAEKARFVAAVLELKKRGVYDQLVKDHRTAMPPMPMNMPMGAGMSMGKMAHRSPWFLPWHREFLLRYERALRKVDAKVTLPYWDWLADRAKSSPLWHADFMGGTGKGPAGHVADGPFAGSTGNWRLTVQSDGVHDPALRRAIGLEGRLPTKTSIRAAIKRTPYDNAPWDDMARPPETVGPGFRPQLEHVVHDPVHGWVGGTMELSTSPNDPVFFLHHANVDRLWAVWRSSHTGEEPYLPVSEGTKYDESKPMPVFPVTPAAMLDHHALGYRYEVEDQP
jgi:tyrosinase